MRFPALKFMKFKLEKVPVFKLSSLSEKIQQSFFEELLSKHPDAIFSEDGIIFLKSTPSVHEFFGKEAFNSKKTMSLFEINKIVRDL